MMHFTEMCSGSEAVSYLRLIDSCITQIKAHGPSRTRERERMQPCRGQPLPSEEGKLKKFQALSTEGQDQNLALTFFLTWAEFARQR